VQFFADNTLFSGLKWEHARGEGPVLLEYVGDPSLKSINWHENRCGYDDRIFQFLVTSTAKSSERQEYADVWLKHWGRTALRSELAKGGGVAYEDGSRGSETRIHPKTYRLKADSLAYRAGVNQLPIGANLTVSAPTAKKVEAKSSPAKAAPNLTPINPVKPVGGL